MDKAQLIQLFGSAVAIGVLVAIAAWARIPRPTPPLDADGARAVMAIEFPDEPIDALWITPDRTGAIARSSDRALVLWRKGDGYAARDAAWTDVLAAKAVSGRLKLRLGDGAPRLVLNDVAWPPPELMTRGAA